MPGEEFSHILKNGNQFAMKPCLIINGVFFSTQQCAFYLKILFLQNFSPYKMVVCFILNNLHFPMVEGIKLYALYKSRVLIIPSKAHDFCLF